jgi:hypothetical protein
VKPHNRNAISLLLTNQRFARTILPLYKLPKHLCRTYHYHRGGDGGAIVVAEERYRFTTFPIQDSQTLLDRLNTRRLRLRILWCSKEKTKKKKKEQLLHKTRNNNDNNDFDAAVARQQQQQQHYHCYEYGRTMEELAYEEWLIMEINHTTGAVDNDNDNDDMTVNNANTTAWRTWPAHLELLRFLNDDYETIEQKEPQQQHIERPITTTTTIGNNWFKNITLLASYPRSGNTLLRTLLERTTCIVTGSDTRPDRTLSISLAIEYDLVGEGIVNGSSIGAQQHQQQRGGGGAAQGGVHIVKTHFPERKGWTPVTGHRVLLLVRNPYD